MSKRGWILWQGLINPSMELFKTATSDQGFELEDGGQRRLALSADAAGTWTRDGQRLSELHDCVDADLEWSPSTNALPIRRLALASGETRVVAAAWIRFPSLEVERLDQSYQRLDERRYHYRSGSSPPTSWLTTTRWFCSTASTGRRSRPAGDSAG